jgi:Family of unknown function (DUF6011)
MCSTEGLFDHLHSDLIGEEPEQQQVTDMRGMFTDAVAARTFMRGGKAVVTLRSKKTGDRFTYRLRASEDGNAIFVGLLTGTDNDSQYSYLGRIARDVFWLGRKVPRAGDISRDAPSAKAFDWTWRKLAQGILPEQLEIWHEGRCGRCGRRLTIPESIANGFGPECFGRI